MKIFSFIGGPVGVNTYIVSDESNNAVVIDPSDYSALCKILYDESLSLRAVLLTHCHFDHIWALDEVVSSFDVPVYCHFDDISMLSNTRLNLAQRFDMADINRFKFNSPLPVSDGDNIDISGLNFKVIHTPGHTAGCVCYLIDGCLFSGDTLFHLSVGRTDCFTASDAKLSESLRKLAELDDRIGVYPGHGRDTSIFTEKAMNPYLKRYST